MAFDGVTAASLIAEFNNTITGGRIDKIFQPENDEIIMNIRCGEKRLKLLLSANPSHPRAQLTEISKENPLSAPLFCMVLRKHLQSGKLIKITQPEFERIMIFHIESISEMGDYETKKLILEIMGRHSNLILVDENDTILESVKHISHDKSSVREVLPGKKYSFPPSKDKLDTMRLEKNQFLKVFEEKRSQKISAIIYQSYNGISPVMASEICYRAGLDASSSGEEISDEQAGMIFNEFLKLVKDIENGEFSPEIIYNEKGAILEFSPVSMKQFSGCEKKRFSSVSALVEFFYKNKALAYHINQKSQDLRRLINQNIERCAKKKDILINTLKEIENRELYRLYGELITANIYAIKQGMTTVTLTNFYSENGEEITIPLESALTPAENAQKYFKRYNKEKRTFAAAQEQTKINDEELEYLLGVLDSLKNCTDERDIRDIRLELVQEGFIKRLKEKKGKAQKTKKSAPMHFKSVDGFDIYVGKNNVQNDELTLRFASPEDIWMHTKAIHGSHVIIVTNGNEVPDSTLEQAATLAAFYSKGGNSSTVPVDYVERKYVKKPSGSKPGMVIYKKNRTAYITPDEEKVAQIERIN